MTAKSTKKRSEKIKADLALVQITARTGRLPIVSESEEWINPTTKRTVPGIILEFEDGICTLHPVHDAETIKAFREWIEDGRDERIDQVGVMEIAKDALTPPFPRWNITNADKLPEMVEALGLDPELCLRYELQKPKGEQRPKLVKALEAKVDAPPVEDAMSEPEL